MFILDYYDLECRCIVFDTAVVACVCRFLVCTGLLRPTLPQTKLLCNLPQPHIDPPPNTRIYVQNHFLECFKTKLGRTFPLYGAKYSIVIGSMAAKLSP